ncbi:hypothetical protein DMB92_02260 [Campylobacter sp. MIT 99-7217]|uniref:hypothetical protein n=1 Tax=Campylobacter sp. MIT 99-7217 TaxID=535091 RepID=UPI00115AE888|nr:hypothetical protein [Campylobacter sp. MIT 99-7217]TQR33731.1 hypothetical protein DMB92_02260 [Campylobacter sp. MIT 99-7217]
MKAIALLSLCFFVLFWQSLSFAFLFLILPFLALFRQNFIILRARKRLLKRAILRSNSFFFRLTKRHFFLLFLSFFLALLSLCSLSLNLMYAKSLDFVLLFAFFPLLYFFLKKRLFTQFKKSSFNTPYIIMLCALFPALIYALFMISFEKMDAFFYLQNEIDSFKTATFKPLEALSMMLHYLSLLRGFFSLYLNSFLLECLFFCFHFFNFFFLLCVFALLINPALNELKYLFLSLFCAFVLLFFYEEQKNKEPFLAQKLSFLIKNLEQKELLFDNNLSKLKLEESLLKELRKGLDKSFFELGIWWFSDEKKELDERLKKLDAL